MLKNTDHIQTLFYFKHFYKMLIDNITSTSLYQDIKIKIFSQRSV